MDMEGLSKKSDEVLVCTDEIIGLNTAVFLLLREMADNSPKRRSRICAHKSSDASIQEMIIVIRQGSYIRPHRHQNKCESFHVIDGSADIVVFEDNGSIRKVIPFAKNACFYYRLDSSLFHTIVVRSESIIFHEVTNGPFITNGTEFATFAPFEDDTSVISYSNILDKMINDWRRSNGIEVVDSFHS